MKKVFVFNSGFLTDYTDGLGVVFADNRKSAVEKMARLVAYTNEGYYSRLINDFSSLDIDEYEMDKFPGVFINGGA